MSKLEEITYYNKRANLFFDFIERKSEDLEEKQDGFNLIEQFKTVTKKAFQEKDLKSIKAINSEIDRWSKELPTDADTLEFYKLLKVELGEDFPKNYKKILSRIAKIGICSNQEYEIVQDRINNIFQKDDSSNEVIQLNKLLLTNEEKNAA